MKESQQTHSRLALNLFLIGIAVPPLYLLVYSYLHPPSRVASGNPAWAAIFFCSSLLVTIVSPFFSSRPFGVKLCFTFAAILAYAASFGLGILICILLFGTGIQ